MKVTRDRNGVLTYRYKVSRDMSFEFHTLAEVGAPYQQEARDIIRANRWRVQYGADLPCAPWVVDRVQS